MTRRRLIAVASLAAAGAAAAAPAATPEILGTWRPIHDGVAEPITAFAGWDGRLFVAAGGSGAWERTYHVDVRIPDAPVVTHTETVGYSAGDEGMDAYITHPFVCDDGIIACRFTEYYWFDAGGDVGMTDVDRFVFQSMPGHGGDNPFYLDIGENIGSFDWPVFAYASGNDLVLRDEARSIAVTHDAFLGGSADWPGYRVRRLDGTRLYLGSSFNNELVYDVSDLENPVLLSTRFLRLTEPDILRDGLVLRVQDDGASARIRVFDASPAPAPRLLSEIVIEDEPSVGINRLVLQDGLLYIAGRRFWVFDLTIPSEPLPVAEYESLVGTRSLGFGEGVVYAVASIDSVRQVVTLRAPEAIRCARSDLAEPYGVLDLADLQTFVGAFVSGDPLADPAEPLGVFDLADVQAFVVSFTAGCP